MGVKKGNDALHAKLERLLVERRAEILKILNEYSVPLLEPAAPAKH